jgi:YqaJ-like recombinase protein
MILHAAAQGSPEWLQARLGIPTASAFHRIVSPTGKPSSQAEGYLHELIAERALGESIVGDAGSLWMSRGSDLEASAIAFYELQRDVTTVACGLCLTDDERAGASPDRLVGELGLLEIKVPSAANHIGYLLDGTGRKHWPQAQGQLLVTGREWVDLLSFNPLLPPALVRIKRDEKFLKTLGEELARFTAQLEGVWAHYVDRYGAVGDTSSAPRMGVLAAPQ